MRCISMSQSICQSCGMPLCSDAALGTNEDGSRSADYCSYCYEDGKFTEELTVQEMVEHCIQYVSKGDPFPDEETARVELSKLYPTLKRWQ